MLRLDPEALVFLCPGLCSARHVEIAGLEAGTLKKGEPADVVVFDPEEPWVLSAKDILSKAKNTPYDGARFTGRVRRTYVGGSLVFVR